MNSDVWMVASFLEFSSAGFKELQRNLVPGRCSEVATLLLIIPHIQGFAESKVLKETESLRVVSDCASVRHGKARMNGRSMSGMISSRAPKEREYIWSDIFSSLASTQAVRRKMWRG